MSGWVGTSTLILVYCTPKKWASTLFFLRFYLFIQETERERQRHRQSERLAPCREPSEGLHLDPGTPGSRPGPKAGTKPLSHPGIPLQILTCIFFSFFWKSPFGLQCLESKYAPYFTIVIPLHIYFSSNCFNSPAQAITIRIVLHITTFFFICLSHELVLVTLPSKPCFLLSVFTTTLLSVLCCFQPIQHL